MSGSSGGWYTALRGTPVPVLIRTVLGAFPAFSFMCCLYPTEPSTLWGYSSAGQQTVYWRHWASNCFKNGFEWTQSNSISPLLSLFFSVGETSTILHGQVLDSWFKMSSCLSLYYRRMLPHLAKSSFFFNLKVCIYICLCIYMLCVCVYIYM